MNAVAPTVIITAPSIMNINYVKALTKRHMKDLLSKSNINDNPFLFSIHKNNYEIFEFLYNNNYINLIPAFVIACSISNNEMISMIIETSDLLLPFRKAFINAGASANISAMETLYAHDKRLLCDDSLKIFLKNEYKIAIMWALAKNGKLLNCNTITCIDSNMSADIVRILYNENPQTLLKLYHLEKKSSTCWPKKKKLYNRFIENLKCPVCFAKFTEINKIHNIISGECIICYHQYTTSSDECVPYTLYPCNHMYCLNCIKLLS